MVLKRLRLGMQWTGLVAVYAVNWADCILWRVGW